MALINSIQDLEAVITKSNEWFKANQDFLLKCFAETMNLDSQNPNWFPAFKEFVPEIKNLSYNILNGSEELDIKLCDMVRTKSVTSESLAAASHVGFTGAGPAHEFVWMAHCSRQLKLMRALYTEVFISSSRFIKLNENLSKMKQSSAQKQGDPLEVFTEYKAMADKTDRLELIYKNDPRADISD